MKLEHIQNGNILEISLTGRMDAYWSGFLDTELEKVIRAGNHIISLDMSSIEYISSAGLRILLKSYNKLNSIDGKLIIKNPSQNVMDILNLTGFSDILKASLTPDENTAEDSFDEISESTCITSLDCNVKGNPEFWKMNENFKTNKLEITEQTFSLGIGAFGEKNGDYLKRLGEYIAVNGTVAYLPTDSDSSEPDFLLSSGEYVPNIQTVYSITCEGTPGISFAIGANALSIAEIAGLCFAKTKSDTVGFVVAGELNGIAGAFLKKSPVLLTGDKDIFSFPEIRKSLSFTPEKKHRNEICLIAGVATKNRKSKLLDYLKPIDKNNEIYGHAHAAVFTYQPLKKGKINLTVLVKKLFENEKLLGIYHLINDKRLMSGAGETIIDRGMCWTGPIDNITVNPETEE